jgi:hypothetical protein
VAAFTGLGGSIPVDWVAALTGICTMAARSDFSWHHLNLQQRYQHHSKLQK